MRDRWQVLREGVQAFVPAANGRMLKAAACMFTNTPDHHFILDQHPLHKQVNPPHEPGCRQAWHAVRVCLYVSGAQSHIICCRFTLLRLALVMATSFAA